MAATAQYLARAASAYKNKDGNLLSQILFIERDSNVGKIINEILPESSNLRALVLKTLPGDDQLRLADLMGSVLQYLCDTALGHEQLVLLRSLRLSKVYESAIKMFALRDSAWFNPCIQQLTLWVLQVAEEKADIARQDNSRDRLVAAITTATNGPLKTAAADNKLLEPLRQLAPRSRDITFWLANVLLKRSFELRDTLASAEPILTFLAPQMENLHLFTRAEQVTFRYYAGCVFLAKEELLIAREHLIIAFDLCTNKSPHNKRPRLLSAFGLTSRFLPLILAIRSGDRSLFRKHLDDNMEWFRKKYIYIILRSKGEALVLRSLFRRTVLVTRKLWPAENPNLPPTVQFEHLLIAALFSYRYPAMGDMELSTWDKTDMEAICASLIDQDPPSFLSPQDATKLNWIELQMRSSSEVQMLTLEDLIARYGPHPYLLAKLGTIFDQAGAPAMALEEYRKTQEQLSVAGFQDDTFNAFVDQFARTIQEEFKQILNSVNKGTYYQGWRPTKLHKFPLNLPHLPLGHQEVKDEWSQCFHPQSIMFQRYLTNVAIDTCQIEATFLLTPESVKDLVFRGISDGLVATAPESAVTDSDKVKRILNDVIAAYDLLADVVADPFKLDREYVCRLHKVLMKTCRFEGRRYNPPGVTRTKTGQTVVISNPNYTISCCSYLQVDEELVYICKMAKVRVPIAQSDMQV
ncbi:hypothetical protein Clacol_008858 [Clathrus columnatus]|uniref:PCI domain-containing protein n=1 Tax=Clathrus columnatus TaxID=1419009 RepID=A0AAV5ALN1_9AGAM|nr:hypothetical protein Clacol_008858 [Clathrus columnatus]